MNIQNLFYYSQNLYMIDDFIQSDQRPYRNINLFFESFFENEKRALLEKGNNYNPERNLFIVRFETVNVSGQKRLLFRNKEQKSEDLSIIKSFCKEIVEKIDEQNLNDFAKGCFLMFLKVQHKRGVVGDFSYIIHEGYQDKDKDGTWYDYSLSNYRSFKMQWEKRYKPTCFALAELKRGILAINPYDDANCRYDKLLREGRHEFNKGDKIEKESHKLFF